MFRNILVPVDFTEKNVPAVEIATEFARRSGAQLTLLHVIEELDLQPSESTAFYRRLESQAKARMHEFVDKVPHEGVEMHQSIVYGQRARMIVHTAAEKETDLIILSSHRIDPEIGQGWGTISYQVALLSPCAVLLVK